MSLKCATVESRLSPWSSVGWVPHAYQHKAIEFLLKNAVGGLFLDMGLGKTACVLAALQILKRKGYMRRTLVIAPLRVCWGVWPVEAQKWSEFRDLKIEVLHGSHKDEALQRDADVYVINPDGLEWLLLERRAEKLKADVLVVDESSAFKRSSTQRFKLLKYLIPHFRRRYILTGTPAPNGLLDLFGQIYILDQGNALGRYITHYQSAYFEHPTYIHPKSGKQLPDSYRWVPKAGCVDVIYEKLRPMVLRMDAKDYLELPATINNTVAVELPEKARRAYRELERQFITLLANGEPLIAPSVAAVGVKLRQIANGGVYRNVEKRKEAKTHAEEWVGMHDEKLDALEEILGSRGGRPVLLAYEFEHDATRIQKRFPHAVFLADFAGPRMQDVIDAWNAGEIELLCAHPASAGHGLNLQQDKDALVWFGLTWNLEHYQQFNARVIRQGNKSSHVFVYHIIAKNTVDEIILRVLDRKAETQDDLNRALKEYAHAVRVEQTTLGVELPTPA